MSFLSGNARGRAERSGRRVPAIKSHQKGRVSIRGLGARTCGPHHQALFWENPQDATLIAYEFRVVLPNGIASPWHSLAADGLPCREWNTHSVLIHHNLDSPWELGVELRGVNAVHHGDPPVSIHLAAMHEVEYTRHRWESRDPRGGRSYIAVGLESEDGPTSGAMRDISAGMLSLKIKEDQSIEEAQSKAISRGTRYRRQGEDWQVPSANARRRSFDHLHPSSLPSESYAPDGVLGETLKSRDWDLRVHAEGSEAWFLVRADRTWEKGYDLRDLPLQGIPDVSFPYDGE